MLAKKLYLFIFSIFALVLVMGLGSANVDFVTKTNDVATVEQGDSVTVSFAVEESNYGNLTNITFNTPLTMTYNTYSFDSEDTITGVITSLDQGVTSDIMSLTFNIPSTQQVGVYEANLTLTGTYVIEQTYNLPITITVEAAEPDPEPLTCEGVETGSLRIDIDDIRVEKGFGDDDEWLVFDEIQIDIDVDNKNDDEKIKDVKVEWGLWSTETNEWVIELDEVDEFDISKDDTETLTIDFKLNKKKLDVDIEDLEAGDYTLYVIANGEEQENPEFDVCALDSAPIEIIIEDDFVVLDNIESTETVSCGTDFQITADVWNIGQDDQDEVSGHALHCVCK